MHGQNHIKNELTCFPKCTIPISQPQSERTGVVEYTDSGHCVCVGQGRWKRRI